jgi:hypothetical protein
VQTRAEHVMIIHAFHWWASPTPRPSRLMDVDQGMEEEVRHICLRCPVACESLFADVRRTGPSRQEARERFLMGRGPCPALDGHGPENGTGPEEGSLSPPYPFHDETTVWPVPWFYATCWEAPAWQEAIRACRLLPWIDISRSAQSLARADAKTFTRFPGDLSPTKPNRGSLPGSSRHRG